MIAMDVDDLLVSVNNVNSQEALEIVLKDLRILSHNSKANNQVIRVLDKAISKAKETNSKRILLNLYSLKITQTHHQKSKIQEIIQIIDKIQLLLEDLDYAEGYSLYYSHLWYIEKIQGNNK
jgi:CRISPR/Cas system CSM-associated protein Csm2 small subunit